MSSFYDVIEEFEGFDFDNYFDNVTLDDVRRSIYESNPTYEDFLNLISPKAEEVLEEMAQQANKLTMQYFGKSVLLYTPMYLANYCINKCAYCGYNVSNKIHRKMLNDEEIKKESDFIADEGFKHILILTGESEYHTPIEYIENAVKILTERFPSVSIEVYPMKTDGYKKMVNAGVEGLTVYQETYNREIYDKIHISGPKKNYRFRLEAVERGADAGMRFINIGALLGLNKFREDAFFTAIHGLYLRKKYPDLEVSYSTPRIRPCVGGYNDLFPVTDKNLVQYIIALRILHPNGMINVSTREAAGFRENLLPLGVRKISAGVSTEVGGHSIEDSGEGQFDTNDTRSLNEIKESLVKNGYQPIMKDWDRI